VSSSSRDGRADEERGAGAGEKRGAGAGDGDGEERGGAVDEERGAAAERAPIRGLLVDWGGVMTTNLFSSFSAFCETEGLDPATLAQAFRGGVGGKSDARELLIGFEEGRIDETDFENELGRLLGLERAEGLIDRLFAGAQPEPAMVEAVRAARGAGIATGLISNSWGTTRYPRGLLAELFDGVVISGEVGIRKPAPRIYELGAEAIGLPAAVCVFVDDLPFNLPPATELGMATVHHTDPRETIAELERLLGIPLGKQRAPSV
jgi:epoxide hydrolase-like predicted phosphatase